MYKEGHMVEYYAIESYKLYTPPHSNQKKETKFTIVTPSP
jgi:hypothetical protein